MATMIEELAKVAARYSCNEIEGDPCVPDCEEECIGEAEIGEVTAITQHLHDNIPAVMVEEAREIIQEDWGCVIDQELIAEMLEHTFAALLKEGQP